MDYDVCLSFAGEDRDFVRAVATELRSRAVRVFYDEFERATLWGKNLYTHLDRIYQHEARYCVMFVSEHYVRKNWTRHEQDSAQSRALAEDREYILPARFDKTPVPGLRDTTAYVELATETPASLADLICSKLGVQPVTESGVLRVHWFGVAGLPTAAGTDAVACYQGVPVTDAPHLEAAVATGVRTLAGLARWDESGAYWSYRDDQRFDRLYATSTGVTALAQLGIAHRDRMLAGAIDYLGRADPASIDDRAAAMGLLTLGRLDTGATALLIDALAARQITEGPNQGSFELAQSAVVGVPPDHRTPPLHADGAAFHACHVADLLLHIPASQPESRHLAQPLLAGVREFLRRSLAEHGRLSLRDGTLSQRTLYGFALCPALSLPLPPRWRDTAREVLVAAGHPDVTPINRCLAVMNCAFLATNAGDPAFTAVAREHVLGQLPPLTADDVLRAPDALHVALALRAIAYGAALIDPRLSGHVRAAARAAAGSIEWSADRGDRLPVADAVAGVGAAEGR